MSNIDAWASWLTVIGGILALFLYIYPKVKYCAIRRGVLYWHWKFSLSFEPDLERLITGPRPIQRKMWFIWQRLSFKSIKYIIPRRDYLMIVPYSQAVEEELQNHSKGTIYIPTLSSDEMISDLAAFVDAVETDTVEQNYIKRHKGVVCATSTCDVKYGQRRMDHDFMCDDGVHLSGGWFCPSKDTNDANNSCFPKATGPHYCGMCLKEMGKISPQPIEVPLTTRF